MKILVLGDVMALSGRKAIKKNLYEILEKNQINFSIINGENAADDGKGITKEIAEELFSLGIDVITSGNHIWDKEETIKFIEKESRLLRPANLAEGSPGKGYGIFLSKDKKFKIGVINLMGNVFMRKSDDVFKKAKEIMKKITLKKNVDFSIVDFHGEITSEKMAIAHFLDGSTTCVVGTHTHVPTADSKILPEGTAFVSDLGMVGAVDSILGVNVEGSLNRFLTGYRQRMEPVRSGTMNFNSVLIDIDVSSGLANSIERVDRQIEI